jgi:hypothetical protein
VAGGEGDDATRVVMAKLAVAKPGDLLKAAQRLREIRTSNEQLQGLTKSLQAKVQSLEVWKAQAEVGAQQSPNRVCLHSGTASAGWRRWVLQSVCLLTSTVRRYCRKQHSGSEHHKTMWMCLLWSSSNTPYLGISMHMLPLQVWAKQVLPFARCSICCHCIAACTSLVRDWPGCTLVR